MSRDDVQADAVIAEKRGEISEIDSELLELVNRRLTQVAALREYKAKLGIPFFDPRREAHVLERLRGENVGPLSDGGVEELVAFLLDLGKRETAKQPAPRRERKID
jgi:chorismate mutase / prephenate dehydratase